MNRLKLAGYLFSLFLIGILAAACSSTTAAGTAPPAGDTSIPPTLTAIPPTPSPVPTVAEFSEPPVSEVQLPSPTPEPTAIPTAVPDLKFDAFVDRVKNGQPDKIVGVYVQDVLELPVVQQPINTSGMPINPGYVSVTDNEATQFLYAYIYADGNIGLLAHNYLAGRYFFNLQEGQIVDLIYGDGRVEEYVIGEMLQYQALSPRSPTSDFLDLISGETISSTELFYRVYGGEKRVTFQTCINRDNDSEWGRFFPIAFPGD